MDKPPRIDLADRCNQLQDEVRSVSFQFDKYRRLQIKFGIAAVLLVMIAGALGGILGFVAGRSFGNGGGFGQVESGIIPVELIQQTVATGSVEFSSPFRRRPLVFICEAGHAGAFLACKTDAISETGFTWAVGAGPVRQDYQSELAWFAIEPK